MTSIDDTLRVFKEQSATLETILNNFTKQDVSIEEILKIYYHIMTVSSMSMMLRKSIGEKNITLYNQIQNTEKIIHDQFDSDIHKQIMQHLETLISNAKHQLSSQDLGKSKTDIESKAKLFADLRQKMSVREFVMQYEKGLAND